MKELQQIVNEQINTMISTGAIEQMIAEKLNATIKECVSDTMRSYGDFAKSIKGKIEESFNASLSEITIPEYNQFISDVVIESYTEAMNTTAKAHMKALLDEKLAPVPKEMTAQALLDEIQKHWADDVRQYGHEEIEIEWEESDNAIFLKAIHPEHDWNFIKVTCYNHREPDSKTYHIGYINQDDKAISGCITGATYALGLAGFFYKLYCAQTKITGFDSVYGENIYVGWD
ncbi:hypothetical protein [Vibrio anguillarum]|uniref:hypothetical protein n=1 Tax=Vibrio anguillarum TaxID=55601 RepID=UPI0018FE083F|nr:hypothetical protein [Vibrio anguillarum]MBF4425259.1 hypothetical protein [Vibrio anguillarum]